MKDSLIFRTYLKSIYILGSKNIETFNDIVLLNLNYRKTVIESICGLLFQLI